MRPAIRYITYMLFALLLGACGGQLAVKMTPYTQPSPLAADETLVYIFREGKFTGGGRKVGIIVNDTYKAVLHNDTFSFFTIKSGKNIVVARMAPNFQHFSLNGRAGETVYLLSWMNFDGMRLEEIDEQKGQELIKKYQYTEIAVKDRKASVDYRTYFDNLYK